MAAEILQERLACIRGRTFFLPSTHVFLRSQIQHCWRKLHQQLPPCKPALNLVLSAVLGSLCLPWPCKVWASHYKGELGGVSPTTGWHPGSGVWCIWELPPSLTKAYQGQVPVLRCWLADREGSVTLPHAAAKASGKHVQPIVFLARCN